MTESCLQSMLTKEQFSLPAVQPCLSNPCAKSKTIVPGFIDDIWETQKVKTVILGGKITDTGFHAPYKNPIPSTDLWKFVPREIEISPPSVPQLQRLHE